MNNRKLAKQKSYKSKKRRFKRPDVARIADKVLLDPWRKKVIEEVQRRCLGLGCQMEGRLLDYGADHWMFNDYQGRRLLNYWPTNGTFWDPNSGFRGTEMSVEAILEMVETILNERESK